MGWESFDVIRFDLWPLLQGQMRIAKIKSAYNSLILVPRSLQCHTNLSLLILYLFMNTFQSGKQFYFFQSCNLPLNS